MDKNTLAELLEKSDRITEFAVYPGSGSNVLYPYAGLIDEFTELVDAVEGGASDEDIFAEAADVVWYANQLLWELEQAGVLSKENRLEMLTSGLVYTARGKGHSVRDRIWDGDCVVWSLKAIGRAGGVVKKIHRDGASSFTGTKLSILKSAFTYLNLNLWLDSENVTAYLDFLIEKLGSRQARNVLHGDGDHR